MNTKYIKNEIILMGCLLSGNQSCFSYNNEPNQKFCQSQLSKETYAKSMCQNIKADCHFGKISIECV